MVEALGLIRMLIWWCGYGGHAGPVMVVDDDCSRENLWFWLADILDLEPKNLIPVLCN